MNTLIENVLIYDGTGSQPFISNLVFSDGKIKHMSSTKICGNFNKVIDGTNLSLCPGFIDTHSHSDLEPFKKTFLNSAIRQGITTEIVGQEGFSCVPSTENVQNKILSYMYPFCSIPSENINCRNFKDYKNTVQTSSYPIKIESLVGHNTLRLCVMSDVNKKADSIEIYAMVSILQRSMAEGALGLSLNAQNSPSFTAHDNEMISLCKTVGENDGIVMINLQNEHNLLMESVDYVARLAEKSKARFHISAFKSVGMQNWGKVSKVLSKIELYCNNLDITFDSYPYIALCINLIQLIPSWAYSNNKAQFMSNICNSHSYSKLLNEVENSINLYGGGENIIITSQNKNSELSGRYLSEISDYFGLMASEMVLHILKTDEDVAAIFFSMSEDDMRKILCHPLQNICTDGLISQHPHPRLYGSFPRVLGHYVRELNLMKFEQAIMKMTSEPAKRLHLWDRGLIREGMAADLVLFNQNTIKDTNSYLNPSIYPTGIKAVWVDGIEKYYEV